MLKRNEKLINAKIIQYLLPGIMMAMALQLGNVVDAIFVGNFLGTDALGALNLALPVDTFIQIPGYVLGTGGAIAAGIMLGKRDVLGASKVFSATFYITLITGILFAIVGAFAAYPLGELLAGGGYLGEMTGAYLLGQMLGAPIIGIGLLMTSYMGVENHPELSSAFLIVSNVINLIADYFLLKFTNIGTLGASLSTVIGFFFGMIVIIFYIRSPKRMIKLHKGFDFKAVLEAIKSGAPILIFMIMTLVKALALNIIVLNMLGEEGIEVTSICEQVLMIVEMLTGGIIGIIPNLAGVLYGEKDYYGIRALCRRVLKYSAIATVLVIGVVLIFPTQMAGLFGMKDALMLEITSKCLQLFMLGVPFFVWNKFLISFYESVEQSALASLITFLQSGVFVIPASAGGIALGLSLGGSGYNALVLASVFSEVLTVLSILIYRKLRYHKSNFYMMRSTKEETCLDFTVNADVSNVPKVIGGIMDFCKENGVDGTKANFAAVAAEEMFVNCVQYGGKGSRWIDICLTLEENNMLLRIRDNGKPFNPLEYEHDADEFASIHGINVIKALATNVSYIRAMDMNNTVIEFNIENK